LGPEQPAAVFLLPQGLTVTGVNTWALSVVREVRRRGGRAAALVHGSARGHAETLNTGEDGVVRVEAPDVDTVTGDAGVRQLAAAYDAALRGLGGPAVLIPTRHDACFGAAAALAHEDPRRVRLALWQQAATRYEDALMSHFEPAASAVVGASDRLAESLRERLGRGDARAIPNAVVVPDRAPDRPESGGLRLLYAGRLESEQKRTGALVWMSDALACAGVAHELVIMGDGPEAGRLGEAARGRGAVRVEDAAGPSAVHAAMERADVFVLPSRAEGLSFAALEAMARGCAAVLARTESGAEEAVEHGVSGWIVETPDDERGAGEAVARGVIAARDHGVDKLGRAARERVRERFSLAAHVDQLEAMLEDTARAPGPAWPAGRPLLARGPRPADGAARARAASALAGGGRFVVHGAGGHTRRIEEALREAGDAVIGLTDGDPSRWGSTFLGWPVMAPERAREAGATDVLISTDLHEAAVWARRGVYESRGLRVHRLYGGSRVALVGTAGQAGHYAGVCAALGELGVAADLECGHASGPVPSGAALGAGVVALADGVRANTGGLVAAAERRGARTALVMDGVCEWGNTFLSERAGTAFLRPAGAGVVLAAGAHDRGILRALGNRAVACGLPRLERFAREAAGLPAPGACGELLVATARTPAATAAGVERVIGSLAALRDACARLGVPARWRVRPDVAAALGVEPDRAPLAESLGRARAMACGASTLALEAMLAGRPVGVVHPHPWPLWVLAAWAWGGADRAGWEEDAARARAIEERATAAAERSAAAAFGGATPGWFESAEEFVSSLMAPEPERSALQDGALRRMHRGRGAGRSARTLARLARAPAREAEEPVVAPTRATAPGALRVVSCVGGHGATVGGVAVWSRRMEDWFAAHPEAGVEWVTLFVGEDEPAAHERLGERERARACVLGAGDSDLERARAVRDSIIGAGGERCVALPNTSEDAWRGAALARGRGVRTLAVAHTDDEWTRALLSRYPAWDGAVGVNERVTAWLRERAREGVGMREIVYGVPEHRARERRGREPGGGPVRLAHVGRVVERQKRVSLLIGVLAGLECAGVDYVFSLIGDGPALAPWARLAAAAGIPAARLRVTGAMPAEAVQRELGEIDGCVIVSEAEGTSIAMLEAMAAGAAPIVTGVPGVRGLVEDGVSGIVVPVDGVGQMSARIAALDGPREALWEMGRRAQERVAARGLTVGACARGYAQAAREAGAQPAGGPAGEHAVRAGEGAWRPRDGADEGEIAAALGELGYGPVLVGGEHGERAAPGGGVVVRADDAHPGEEAIARWRGRGVGVAVAPGLDDEAASHLTGAFEALVRGGARRVVVGGAGGRAAPARAWIARRRRECVAAFLCPGAAEGARQLGAAAVGVEGLRGVERDAVLLPSTRHDLAGLAAVVAGGAGLGEITFVEPSDHEVARRVEREVREAVDAIDAGRVVVTTLPAETLPGAVELSYEELLETGAPDEASLVFLAGEERDFAVAAALGEWSGRGGVVRSVAWPGEELTAPGRYAALVRGAGAHAVYGAGAHTRRLLAHAPAGTPGPAFVLDDAAEGEVGGAPVVRPQEADLSGVELVVLSSTRFERALWERAAGLRSAGVRVVPLYTAGLEEEAAAR